jgi:hypothetical protein
LKDIYLIIYIQLKKNKIQKIKKKKKKKKRKINNKKKMVIISAAICDKQGSILVAR